MPLDEALKYLGIHPDPCLKYRSLSRRALHIFRPRSNCISPSNKWVTSNWNPEPLKSRSICATGRSNCFVNQSLWTYPKIRPNHNQKNQGRRRPLPDPPLNASFTGVYKIFPLYLAYKNWMGVLEIWESWLRVPMTKSKHPIAIQIYKFKNEARYSLPLCRGAKGSVSNLFFTTSKRWNCVERNWLKVTKSCNHHDQSLPHRHE